ncbi:ferredoxin oxidoreductase [Candidatus Parcubacteria bacterium]|jgi:2-oxoglutarate/2-oxoacid ferredoxin oxidoreductase subunit alpha|nr:ferredoxin oxidoreductase [Candidatus Parcubacteria bacterium]MBT3949337.1 ferredoxin oxidoreductase [Candidatus Parcubacteria bacterium]
MENNKQFLTGHEVVVQACIDADATHMFGYPITPGTEILSGWIKKCQDNKDLHFLQTEDEIAAGFTVCGALMAGSKSFTATAGPGTVLMQDAMGMADGMRLPFVTIIAQRGGPSSGTVIYSQQEVNLAIHGGNGEGLRIVYSPSTVEELYVLTRKTFNVAWEYRFPSVLLTDGYLLKTKQDVVLNFVGENVEPKPLVSEHTQKNIRNIYTFEQELMDELTNQKQDFDEMAKEVTEFESYKVESCDELIIAHGIVGAAARDAVDELKKQGKNVGLFRPITLSPFPKDELNKLCKQVKKIMIVESSMGQLKDLVKQNLDTQVEIDGLYKPAVGIETEEIIKLFK